MEQGQFYKEDEMAKGATSGIITFLDNEYTIEGLEKAISKSNETYVEPGSIIHEFAFDALALPANWAEKYRKPIVTQRDGKYVLIFTPASFMPDVEFIGDGKETAQVIKLKTGFKARFVTKYNLNQAKPYVAPKVDVNTPIYEAPAPRTYDRPKQYQNGGGYNNNRRYGGRS